MKKIDLFIGHLGNGATCCDKSREKNGDFLKVAHIATSGEVQYYEKLLPEDKMKINQYAWITFGEDIAVREQLALRFKDKSFNLLDADSAIEEDQLVRKFLTTIKDVDFSIKVYRHKMAPEHYERELFYTYTKQGKN